MSLWQLIRRGLAHHWRLHVAVAAGVMAGTAVLTGALLVGDSVRGSLRDLAVDRLGRVDEALVSPHFFREQLADEVAAQLGFGERFDEVLPAIVMRVSLERDDSNAPATGGSSGAPEDDSADPSAAAVRGFSGRVNLLAVSNQFWTWGEGGAKQFSDPAAQADAIVLNEPLAEKLGVAVGQTVLLRLPEASLVPRETTLGRKSGFNTEAPLKVVEIIPARGLGRFGLQPNQQLPLNAYAQLGVVQRIVGERGKANALLVAGGSRLTARQRRATDSQSAIADPPPAEAEAKLQEQLRPTLTDYGVKAQRVANGEIAYINLTTDRMLFEAPVAQAALDTFGPRGAQPTLTYLANYIAAGPPLSDEAAARLKPADKRPNALPYSTVTAIDFETAGSPPQLGRWTSRLAGKDGGIQDEVIRSLARDEIALNSWAFDDLNKQLKATGQPPLKLGDEIRLTYFEPEHPDGKSVEKTVAFKLRGVFPLAAGHPANDREFTPTVKGVTDRDSLQNWDAPFEYYQGRVRTVDDEYWRNYRATPKAFVSLTTGQKLWGTERFGKLTSTRVPAADGVTAESVAVELAGKIKPPDLGFVFQPVKRQALMAATGTTPFSVLFVSFSFFIIAAAVMLVAILFRLGVEQRATEIGTLLAEGFAPRRVRRVLAAEGLIVAAVGGLAGTVAGLAYAAVMLYGLRTWWVKAISTPFLTLHTSWLSFAIGYASGVIVCFAAVWWTLWRMRKLPVRRLLAGQATEESDLVAARPKISRWIAISGLALGALLIVIASTMGGMARAGAFFGSGFAVLTGLLALMWSLLRTGATGSLNSTAPLPLTRLAARNGARNPSRSTLTIGLVAAATFLVVALSVFQVDPSQQRPDKSTGNGGFALVAESGSPIVVDINDKSTLTGLQDDQRAKLDDVTIYSLRVEPGEDASCRNLYQTARPRVLGVPKEMIARGGFAWAGSLAKTAEEKENPWKLLEMRNAEFEMRNETRSGETDSSNSEFRLPNSAFDSPIPVVLDLNTAQWSLHLGSDFGSPLGATFTVTDDWGRKTPLQVVGLLSNSIFQGDVLMSEEAFLQRFPGTTGKQFFLVELPPEDSSPARVKEVRGLLETGLADAGFDAENTGDRLAGFLAVQNTYLSTFQSLGALGLLLGTFGLATVQLRSVLERRGELALMRAAGFRRRRLAELVMTENSLLLLAGLGAGTLAALAAVLPHIVTGGAHVPLGWLMASLSGILVVGLAAGLAAVRATLHAPLIQALRGE